MARDWRRVHGFAECQNASHSRNIGFDSAQPTLLYSGDSNPSAGPILTGSADKAGPVPNGIEVGRTLTGVDMGRALSGVEGNAGRATESSSGHASLKIDMENRENDSPPMMKKL